ncbi:MAG: lipopolysaccharide heptosyltransferase II [Elusimicrobiota bacterium]|nr:lipopolysaccharide heptosyltransferase II [Endomicrobiia bacterium]MDW8165865.1 lipopolysaccharide heptosyltransferase II [Elusimicrobiota bacterium]
MKILIIKPSGLGDIIHSLPVAIGLKHLYSGCEIHWLVFDKFKDILDNFILVDKIIVWRYSGGIKEYIRLIKELRREDYDLIIDLQVLLRTSFLGYLIKYKKVISTSFIREFSFLFVNPVAKFDKRLHAVERNYQVVEYLSKKESKNIPLPIDMLPWIKIPLSQENKAKEILEFNEAKKYILISLGSRGSHKIWPAYNFLKLINLLKNYFGNLVFVFVGLPEEKVLFDSIKDTLEVEYKNLIGKVSLKEIPSIVNMCDIVISNDNGIAHLSAALDKPTLVLFGPSNPEWFYPYNKKSRYIYKNLKCSPCGIKTICKDNICMKEITTEEVFDCVIENFSKYLI